MTELLCGICNAAPKKYKCPTCALPYCSIPCFKAHKLTHTSTSPAPAPTAETPIPRPQPPPSTPTPRYLKQKTDFSVLATNPKFHNLLKTHPTLLASLQRVYAKTIEPDPEDAMRRRRLQQQTFRGRGGKGRGRGRGGRWNGRRDEEPKWTQKQGDAEAMGLLKGMRSGEGVEKEKEGMAEFVRLVEELCGKEGKEQEPTG